MEMEKFNAKAFFIFMGIILLLCIGARFAQEFSAEQEKNHEIRMELTRSNVKVAEDMVAKELNTDNKNFRMTAVPGDLLNRSYWITKELVSEIKKMGKNTESTLKQKESEIVKGILLCINLQVYIKFLKKSR